jgi:hypothetical protein
LSDSGKTTVVDFLGIELEGVVRVLEALLDERGEFADSTTFLAEHFLGVSSADDDL